MTPARMTVAARIETSPLLFAAILAMTIFMMVATMVEVPYLGAKGAIVDFDAFYIVGQMVRDGTVASAYDADAMFAAQRHYSGTDNFMPWTYPPHYNLFTALLPSGSRPVSYAIFMILSLGAYVVVLRRIAGDRATAVLLATAPAIIITMRIGQNGYMMGALVGWFCLAFQQRRAQAGIPLGLMLVKPHLVAGLALLCLLRGRWQVLALAALIGSASMAVATLVFGLSIWPAFLAGVRQAADFMELGSYPLFRMTSIYAMLHTLGVDPALAMAAQVASALLACGAILFVCLRQWPVTRILGVTALATLAISPYSYDYDMPIFGIALAFLAADLLDHARLWEKVVLLFAAWLACGWGLGTYLIFESEVASRTISDPLLSLGALGYAVFLVMACIVLTRDGARRRAPSLSAPGVA